MGRLIKTFSDNSRIEYDRGNFDNWCIYYYNCHNERKPPKDVDYFLALRILARKYGTSKVYEDFVKVYNMVEKDLDNDKLHEISILTNTYGEDSIRADITFSILYAAMIAEEKVVYTKLGKRIKRLGVHLLLIENKTIEYAANIMRGKMWTTLDAQCREYGF